MSKHTPGPWKVEGDEHGHWVCLPGKDTFVCEMANEVSFDEVGANARLIAAAPELLEALKRIYENCTGGAVSIARDAIAKVEGNDG